jgi:hypothetical protein
LLIASAQAHIPLSFLPLHILSSLTTIVKLNSIHLSLPLYTVIFLRLPSISPEIISTSEHFSEFLSKLVHLIHIKDFLSFRQEKPVVWITSLTSVILCHLSAQNTSISCSDISTHSLPPWAFQDSSDIGWEDLTIACLETNLDLRSCKSKLFYFHFPP